MQHAGDETLDLASSMTPIHCWSEFQLPACTCTERSGCSC